MPVELEAKIPVDTHQPVQDALRAAGAIYRGRVLEVNHLLDRDDYSLRNEGCGLRVRTVTVEDGNDPGATMTFKGPKRDGPFKQREEHETKVGDALAALAILRTLGYTRELVFEKRRETWQLGDCTIELDELPELGRFVEIEGPSEEAITMLLAKLGLDASHSIAESYVGLLVARVDSAVDQSRIEFRF